MSGSPQNDSANCRVARYESAGAPGELRQLALDAVRHVNGQFIDFLCAQAATPAAPFPFAEPLRMRFARLTCAERARLSRCGTLLVELGLSDPGRWRMVGNEAKTPNSAMAARSNHWMLSPDAFVIAHGTVLVVWSVLHLTRAEAGVLLGISTETADGIVEMGVTELSRIAQCHPEWVHLRWAHLADVWCKLLDFCTQSEPERFKFTALRCLQLSLGKSASLERYTTHERGRVKDRMRLLANSMQTQAASSAAPMHPRSTRNDPQLDAQWPSSHHGVAARSNGSGGPMPSAGNGAGVGRRSGRRRTR